MRAEDPAFVHKRTLVYLWLFCKPSVSVQQFDANALFVIDFVLPNAVDFRFQLLAKRRGQSNDGADGDVPLENYRGAAAADFYCLSFNME